MKRGSDHEGRLVPALSDVEDTPVLHDAAQRLAIAPSRDLVPMRDSRDTRLSIVQLTSTRKLTAPRRPSAELAGVTNAVRRRRAPAIKP